MRGKLDENIFTFIFLLVCIGFTVMALDFGPRARFFPFWLGLAASIMLSLQLVANLWPNAPKLLRAINKEGAFTNVMGDKDAEETGQGREKSIPWPTVFYVTLWLSGYVLLIHVFESNRIEAGYLIASAIFLLTMIYFAGKEKLRTTLIFTGVSMAFLYLLLEMIL